MPGPQGKRRGIHWSRYQEVMYAGVEGRGLPSWSLLDFFPRRWEMRDDVRETGGSPESLWIVWEV